MADEQKKQGNQPNREGQTTDPNRQGQPGQRGTGREQNNPERGTERTTETGRESGTETRNRPEGDVEGIGNPSRR